MRRACKIRMPTSDPTTSSDPHTPSAASRAPRAAAHSTASHPEDIHGHEHRAPAHAELIVKLNEHTKLAETFDELEFSAPILESIRVAGYTKPTPIQSLFIPHARSGRDVMGQAQT